MTSLTDYISFFAWLCVILIVFISFRGLKGNGKDFQLIKHWSTRNHWKGEITTATIISWKQAQATHNYDYFYIFTIECNIDGMKKKYNAAGVVKISHAALLKKGQTATIKYQDIPPKKIAILDIEII